MRRDEGNYHVHFYLLNVFQSIHEKESFLSQVMFLKYYENNLN